MATPHSLAEVIDLGTLRRSCAQCSLGQLCLPAGISGDDVDRLERLVKKRRPLHRGDYLYRTGAPLHALYVAREGTFKTVSLGEDGSEQVIGFHLPGELIGLDGLGEGVHRCESIALEDAHVCEVPYSELGRVAAEVPGLQMQLFRVMGRSMGRDQDHLEMLGRRQANERMALFLHSLSERLRQLGHPPDAIHLSMSREELASYLGLVIETVSRTLSRMQDDGLIRVQGRKLKILDMGALDKLAHEVEGKRSRA